MCQINRVSSSPNISASTTNHVFVEVIDSDKTDSGVKKGINYKAL